MAIKLSEVAEGSILLLNENGSPVEFYVAKHDYEAGLNGSGRTLVVRKDCYDTRAWHSSNVNAFTTSTILGWLESTYASMLDANVRTMIGSTKVYYTPGNGNTTVTSGEFTVFLLSVTELGKAVSYANTEGSALPIASTLKVAYRNGSAVAQWTRSPYTNNTNYAYYLGTDGNVYNGNCTYANGSRPAFTLPGSQTVADNGNGQYEFSFDPPQIEAPSDLGSKRTPFSFTYTVTDPSGGTLDIVESIGGVTIGEKTGIASGAEVECAVDQAVFDSLTDATEHTITITATSSGGLTATAEVVFRKQVALLSFEQYISENAALRQTLADTLTEKGVEASGKEGYASLVPKVASVTGGENLDAEITTQDDLIAQLQTAIQGKAGASSLRHVTGYLSEEETEAGETDVIEAPGTIVYALVSTSYIGGGSSWWGFAYVSPEAMDSVSDVLVMAMNADGTSTGSIFGYIRIEDGNKLAIAYDYGYGQRWDYTIFYEE